MLQKKVVKTGPRRDPRMAALAVAAVSAAALTFPCPPDVAPLAAGLPRPAAAASRRAAEEDFRRPAGFPPSDRERAAPDSAVPAPATGAPAPEKAPFAEPPEAPASPLSPEARRPSWTAFEGYAARAVSADVRAASRAANTNAARAVPIGRGLATAEPARVSRSLAERAGGRILEDRPRDTGPFPIMKSPAAAPAPMREATNTRLVAGPEGERRSSGIGLAVGAEAPRASLAGSSEARPEKKRGNERRSRSRPAPHRRVSKPNRPRALAKRRAPRPRPLLLARLIGRRALIPPPAGLEAPTPPARPARDREGRALLPAPAALSVLDGVDPARFSHDRNSRPHWDADVWHRGTERGLEKDGAWLSLRLDKGRWWAFADGGAQVRHDGVWWEKERGVWLVVHEGRLWAWRSFQDWDAQGLFHPGSGTEMVYSQDFARVAVITPGVGADVYDSETGETLARIPEERMPPRRRPRRPRALAMESIGFDR